MEWDLERIRAGSGGVRAVEKYPLARHTTIGIGGEADIAFFPKNAEELVRVLCAAEEEGAPCVVLGNGSNILVADAGVRGVVVWAGGVCAVRRKEMTLEAECGVTVPALLRAALESGLGGLHFLAGIPASVGGAVYMNAGAQGRFIGGSVRRVTVLEDGRLRTWERADCRFSYKHTAFMDRNCVIVSAELAVFPCDRQAERRRIAEVLSVRRRLPVGRSMGCVFQNPPGTTAGRLIEEAGLKGCRCGDAYVSGRHANFIINGGRASADDVRCLIERIRQEVLRRTGIRLEEEIRYIGEF